MPDRLAPLYPAAAQSIRLSPSLPAPRFANPPSGSRNIGTARDFYGKTMLREVCVGEGDDAVAFIDKAFPHSRYDVMMLVSDDEVRTAVTDLAPATTALLFDVAGRFVRYLSDRAVMKEFALADGHLHVSYNYDRDTTDRENSMFYDKRFHLHLNYWPGQDLRGLRITRWGGHEDAAVRRQLVDPIAHLAALVIHDITGGSVAGRRLMEPDPDRDVAVGIPVGPKLSLPGWGALDDPDLPLMLAQLHRAAETAYQELYRCFTGEPHRPQPWWRPDLLPLEEIVANLRTVPWLSPAALEGLTTLATHLRDISPERMQALRTNETARIRSMSLGGLDYAISMFSQLRNRLDDPLTAHGEVFLVLQAKLFADIGGAGLPSLDDTALVRIDRSAGSVMSEAEVADRTRLREQFLDREWSDLTRIHHLREIPL